MKCHLQPGLNDISRCDERGRGTAGQGGGELGKKEEHWWIGGDSDRVDQDRKEREKVQEQLEKQKELESEEEEVSTRREPGEL